MRRRTNRAWLLGCTVVVALGCGQASLTVLTPDGSGPGGTPTPSWRNTVLPAMSSRCASDACHGANTSPAGKLPLSADAGGFNGDEGALRIYILTTGGQKMRDSATLTNPLLEVNTSNADESLILCHGLNNCEGSHSGSNAWGSTGDKNYKKVRAWIVAGAPDN